MARKNVLSPTKISAAQSLSSSFFTPATTIIYADNVGYQVNVTTSDSVGSFTVQASLDYAKDAVTNVVTNAGTWTTLTLSGTPVVAGAADSILINLDQLPFYAVRLAYTASTPGTGTCDVYVMHKQEGG